MDEKGKPKVTAENFDEIYPNEDIDSVTSSPVVINQETLEDEAEKTEEKREKINKIAPKKKLRLFFLIPAAFLLIIAFVFLAWFLAPKKKIDICLLDKTVPTADENSSDDVSAFYRKHQGFYWILEQQKYVMGNGDFYDYKKDYFGPMIDENGKVKSIRNMTELDFVPNLMYVADAYGSELYEKPGKPEEYQSGLNSDDMSVISYSHINGATVIAETEFFNTNTDDTVAKQMMDLCAIKPTTWVGRYIFELQDFTDVPEWAPPMYELQEGVEWQFAGPGILLCSGEGKIIVLEEKTDFQSKNLLQISINEAYKKEFSGLSKCNFYNWFELIDANYETEVIADFEFDVNAVGMEKIKEISKTPRFAAITRKKYEQNAPAYYFAGDFNDYVSKLNYNRFLFANSVYRWISFDRSGDISNFFWNFYSPLMVKILGDVRTDIVKKEKETIKNDAKAVMSARIQNGNFEILTDDKWVKLEIKAMNLNATMPGDSRYTRDFYKYKELINMATQAGVNCLRVYDLLPAEFYRALYENNKENTTSNLYIIQNITTPENITAETLLTSESIDAFKTNIKQTIDATHGRGSSALTLKRQDCVYLNDISSYVLSYIVNVDSALIPTLGKSDYTYSGKYFGSNTPIESFYSMLCDYAMEYNEDAFGYMPIIGAENDTSLLKGAAWLKDESFAYNVDNIAIDDTVAKSHFFISFSMMPTDMIFKENKATFAFYSDAQGPFPYGGYIYTVKNLVKTKNVLIDRVGLSTNTNAFENDPTINGLTEKEQGMGIVRMMDAIKAEGYICGIVADLNDNWSAVSTEQYPYTVPIANNGMWQNMLDPAQTSGVLAVESKTPLKAEFELNALDRMEKVSFSSNPAYMYITVQLNSEVNYDQEQMFIGLDMYQRNDGEYTFDNAFYGYSLSGMEYMIKFESKTSASLYVCSSYNRNNGKYSSVESNAALFDFEMSLRYGNFSLSENHFYQTGSTIYIRLPWSALNVTDPSQKLVINDLGPLTGQVKTVSTNGSIFYLLIGDKTTAETLLIFPENKKATGYSVFNWSKWETVSYEIREKESYKILKNYFLK